MAHHHQRQWDDNSTERLRLLHPLLRSQINKRATSEAGGKQNQTRKQNQASRDADAQPQPLIPVEQSTEPSEKLHAADKADESAGAMNPPANHAERENKQLSLNHHDIDPDPFCFSR
jgi:hypothetical protein